MSSNPQVCVEVAQWAAVKHRLHVESSMNEGRNTWCPHVTVASVVADAAGRFLMVEEDIHGRLRYNQPAGHLEPG
jgi:hypothetical protein